MLVSKEVEVRIVGRNMEYYEGLGYAIPRYYNKKENKYVVKRGTYISVNVEDLPKQSHILVDVECDYCNKMYQVRYDAYNKQKDNDISKDCCVDCRENKNVELNLLRYGVKNQFQRETVKEKSKQTHLKRYGYDHPAKNPKIISKIINTMSKNGNVQASRQQLYIHQIIGGILNYNDNTTGYYSIDVAYPEEKIAVEYDGSGHDLQVQFKNLTSDEFKQKEIVRSSILRRNGWKEITIISRKDWIPDDFILLDMINQSVKHFKKEHSWITYDIDRKTVTTSKSQDAFDFGRLRRIYKDSTWHIEQNEGEKVVV